MKLNKFLTGLGLLAALGLASCSNDDNVTVNNEISDGTNRYVGVTLTNSPSTRAGEADPYKYGTTAESSVTKVRIYFFDGGAQAAPVKKATSGYVSYYDVTPADYTDVGPANEHEPNDEKIFNAVLAIETPKGDRLPEYMLAVVNTEDITLPTDPKDCDRDAIAQLIVSNGSKFMMSSSVYYDTKKTYAQRVNIRTTADAAKNEPTILHVERLKARVDVTATTTYEGDQIVEGVKLHKTGVNIGDDDVYVKFAGWQVTTEMPKTYLIKEYASTWNATTPWDGWNYKDGFRCFWAQNPTGYTTADGVNAFGYIYHSYNDTQAEVGNSLYTTENAADTRTGREFTKVLVKGTLCKKDGTAFTISSWQGAKYAGTGAIAAVLGNLFIADDDHINWWRELKDGETDPGWDGDRETTISGKKWIRISGDDIEFATSSTIAPKDQIKVYKNGTVTTQSVNGENRYESYLKLKDNTVTWRKLNGAKDGFVEGAISCETINNKLKGQGTVRVWQTGMTYYFFDIKHINAENSTGWTYNTGNTDAKKEGYYGVVRNHIYNCDLTGVKGLGTPVLDPDEVIIPERPSDDNSYIGAQIRILSWRIVKHNYSLE